jgi:NAD(P)-dependent dehydrogenase (short-subunit alcohol dehydrogenase family)
VAIYPELRDRVALVAGGNRGIGRAIAQRLAANQVPTVLAGAPDQQAEVDAVAAELAAASGASVLGLTADLTRGLAAERVVQAAVDHFGRIDILVNCVGGFPRRRLVTEMDEDEWDAIVALNLKSAFVCARAVLPGMIERRWGRIIHIASEAGRTPLNLTAAHYAASKAGVIGFTRHLAREVAEHGVTVNATAPSTTKTERIRGLYSADVQAELSRLIPLGRLAEPDEQAGIVLFLASDDAAYITGACIDVAGGKIML